MFRIRKILDNASNANRQAIYQVQDIFYERSDVFTCSIHGDPAFAYPYFSGFSDETGLGEGKGANYQEGGYRTRTLGLNARSFFEGLHQGHYGP